MPGGTFDSSKTRVAPVFGALAALDTEWMPQLLSLAQAGASQFSSEGLDLRFERGAWGESELPIPPPVSLLSWMIRNPGKLKAVVSKDENRNKLLQGDPTTTGRALDLLRSSSSNRDWFLFEGPTVPDAWIETPDAIIVVEGKRTEAGPTTDTTWLSGRHQIWRHIDAAWERRGRRQVFGLFIVEAEDESGVVPDLWISAVANALSDEVMETSFPHRSHAERDAIRSSLVGVTTWQRVLESFELPRSTLIDRV